MRAWQSSDLFLTVIPPPLECAWRLMTARTRRVSQTIIEVGAKSLDGSRSGDRRQAVLPIAERGPAAHSYQKLTIVLLVCWISRAAPGIRQGRVPLTLL